MADLSSLKQRVELVDLRLKTAHGARERESAALMKTWGQIRDRFVEQNTEIAELRDRVADLEDARHDLLQMVHGLLAAVEGGLDRMSDECVPQIRAMAADLLEQSDGNIAPTDTSFDNALAEALRSEDPGQRAPGNLHDDLLESIEQSIETARHSDTKGDGEYVLTQRDPAASDFVKETVSPGLRDLVARIESAVGPEILHPQPNGANGEDADARDGEDDGLTRELEEIEALRGELHGLRQRISGGAL